MLVSPLVVRQAVPMPLTERERDVLDFERAWWTLDDPRDELIRARFACTPEAYARELAALVDSSDALAHDPFVVHRLRRQQDRARRARYQEVAR
jgi:Protein of unknown function (DUF3263)